MCLVNLGTSFNIRGVPSLFFVSLTVISCRCVFCEVHETCVI